MDELNKIIDEIWLIDEHYRDCGGPCLEPIQDVLQQLLQFIEGIKNAKGK